MTRIANPLERWLLLPAARPFYEALIDCGEAGQWEPEHMLQLIAGECDYRSVRNAAGYSGLTQIGRSELRSICRWFEEKDGPFHLAPPDVQIRRGTFLYFENKRRNPQCKVTRWESAAHLWHANLAPGRVGRIDGLVYARETDPVNYAANSRLDMNGDGVIDRADLARAIAADVAKNSASYVAALEGLRHVRAERDVGACLPETPPPKDVA